MTTETPRTDAARIKRRYGMGNPITTKMVYADFARTLERELAATTAERDRLDARLRTMTGAWNDATSSSNNLRVERDRLRGATETAITELVTLVPRLSAPYRRNVEALIGHLRATD